MTDLGLDERNRNSCSRPRHTGVIAILSTARRIGGCESRQDLIGWRRVAGAAPGQCADRGRPVVGAVTDYYDPAAVNVGGSARQKYMPAIFRRLIVEDRGQDLIEY